MNGTYIERGKSIKMWATVTNTTDHKWSDMQGYLVLSDAPLTDDAAVDDAADSPPDLYSGERFANNIDDITNIGRLKVGESKRFRIRVPYKRIGKRIGSSPAEGVYQAGIHVFATDEEGYRDPNTAIGRVRTFLPYLDDREANADPIDVSMLWPFTTSVHRAADGTYPDADELIDEIRPSGRLGRLLRTASDAPDRSITLLLDPALIQALSAIARDSYGPPADDESGLPSSSDLSGATDDQKLAATYLNDLQQLASRQDVWTTPYASPDLDALAAHEPQRQAESVYQAAERASRAVLDQLNVTGRIAYVPPDGVAGLDALRWAQSHTDTSDQQASAPAAVLAPKILNDWDDTDSALLSLDSDESTIPTMVDDRTVMSGGPLPGQSDSALQIRQRLASEAVIRALERSADSSVSEDLGVVIDPEWDPGPNARRIDLFNMLDATWVTPDSPEHQLDSDADRWRGPIGDVGDESEPIPDEQITSAAEIVRDATDLASMLDDGEQLADYYGSLGATVASQDWRDDPKGAPAYAAVAVDDAGDPLSDVTIEGPGSVSFSGNSGRLPITIHNGLDETITVGVQLHTEGNKASAEDEEPAEIGPGQSTSYTIDADLGEISNTAFTARLMTPDGTVFGKPAEFNVRSSVVGTAIWIGMGIAGLLVIVAFVRRIRRRRAAGPTTGEAEQ